jgi:hypothetical protein
MVAGGGAAMLAPRTMGTSTAAGTIWLALLAGLQGPVAGDPPTAARSAQGVALELQDAFAAVAEQVLTF